MNVNVRMVSEDEMILEVHTRNGIKDLTITRTDFGFSYPDYSDWDISDDNYYDLEEYIDQVVNRMNGESSSLNVNYVEEQKKEECEVEKIGVDKNVLFESWKKELGHNRAVLLACNYPVKMVYEMTDEAAEAEIEAITGM